MEYDIIEKAAQIAAAEERLDAKLERIAELIREASGFEACAVYMLDPSKGSSRLKAASPAAGWVEAYYRGEGLPGVAYGTGRVVEALKRSLTGINSSGVEDRGLGGFRSAFVAPLKGDSGPYGCIYLKAREKKHLSGKRLLLVRALALQASMAVRFSRLSGERDAFYSELKDTKAKLASAERLMAMGDMAATLAHDIKNPLISVGGFAIRLKKQLGPDSPLVKYVDQIIKEVGRVEKIMNAITRCLMENETDLRPDDINGILEESLELFMDELKARKIRLVKEFGGSPLPVLADREQLKIAFDNLIANAVQSMRKGGTLTLMTCREKDRVLAKVRDSGGGISPADIGFIFNPFFTTKEHGTGLGLSITSSIVIRHNGVIEVNNDAPIGVTFVLKLPYAEMRIVKQGEHGLSA